MEFILRNTLKECLYFAAFIGDGLEKVKVKLTPWQAYACTEGKRRYSSNPLATSTLEGVGGQHHVPAALLPGKTQYPM